MFARIKKTGKYEYVQVVHNERIDGKVRQRVIATLGRLDVLKETGQLDQLVESLARLSDHVAVLWLQNRDSSWYNHARDAVPAVDAFRVAVEGLPDGQYEVEWWETWKGAVVRTERVEIRDGLLPLTTASLKTDTTLAPKGATGWGVRALDRLVADRFETE